MLVNKKLSREIGAIHTVALVRLVVDGFGIEE